jgi:calcineurin-like phosphoesterase family protein
MSNIFFCADHHFNHEKVITFGIDSRRYPTIEAHDEAIIAKHNDVVRPKDICWFLGDFCLGGDAKKMKTYARRLNGRKRFIFGNHDTFDTADYLEVFEFAHGVWPKYGAVLSHIPLNLECVAERYALNIHGHLHEKSISKKQHRGLFTRTVPNPLYYCVSLEQHNMAPVSLDDIRKARGL